MHNLQAEYLKELMNIAIGAATASIADILEAFATMHIPEISIYTPLELKENLESYVEKNKSNYVARQLFSGIFSGEALFILTEESASNLCNHLYPINKVSEDEKIDSILEMANIINATVVGRLAQELDTQVQFSVPTAKHVNNSDIIKEEELIVYNRIISIQTIMTFKDQEITGNIYILTKDKDIKELLELVDNKLEELFS